MVYRVTYVVGGRQYARNVEANDAEQAKRLVQFGYPRVEVHFNRIEENR